MGGELRRIQVQNLIDNGKLLIGDGYRAKNTELSANGLPFARAGNINNGFHFEDADRFPYERIHRVGSKISQAGDVVFTSKGTVGRFALVRPDTERFVYSPQLCFWRSLDPSFIDPRFLYYWMHSREFYVQYKSVSGQTDMAEYVSLSDQRRMYISLPPLAQQRAIAHILGTLDDKIQLNRRMNETLEAMARALFKSWFVDFDPVRAKAEGRTPSGMDAETAKLFPSEFVDSELGPIPKGWQIGNIANVASNRRDTVHPKDVQPGIVYVGLEHLPRARLFFEETGTPDDLKSLKVQFSAGEVLFGKLRPYFKKVAVAPCEGIGSTEILVLSPRPNANAFVALLAASDPLIEHAVALSDGTRMPRTSWEQLTRFLIAVPPEPILRAFNEHCIAFFRRAEAARRESIMLARLRDELLPRLLSGELPVDAAERVVEEVA